MHRLTIGELAQASGLSPATIRRYGAAGVLPPAWVDDQTGYRSYDASQVEKAVLARILRQLEVPLDEVKAILDEPDPASRLARLQAHSWPVAAGGVVLAVVATVVLVRHERRVHDALLPRRVLVSARLQAGCGGIAASSALWTAVVFVLSQQLQEAGRGAGEAALAILPCSGGIVVGGTLVVPPLRRWVGSVRTAIGGLVAGSVSVGWLATLPEQIAVLWPVMPPLALLGVALSAVSTGLKENTLKRAPQGAEAVSAAVFESSTHVGGALAVATYATLLAVGGPSHAYVAAAVLGLAGAGVVVRRGLGVHRRG